MSSKSAKVPENLLDELQAAMAMLVRTSDHRFRGRRASRPAKKSGGTAAEVASNVRNFPTAAE